MKTEFIPSFSHLSWIGRYEWGGHDDKKGKEEERARNP